MPNLRDAVWERGLPESVEAERLVLGSIQINDSHLDLAASIVTADDFALEKHRRIFSAMCALRERGEKVDRVTVAHELIARKQLESVDGLSYLASLDDGLPEIPAFEEYVRIVEERAVLRRAVLKAQRLVDGILDGVLGVEDVRRTESALRALSDRLEKAAPLLSLEEYIAKSDAGIERFLSPGRFDASDVVPFPWPELNALYDGGMRPGEMHVVGARPGVGKSAFASQVSVCAARLGMGVSVFNLEMVAASVFRRMVAFVSRVPLKRMRSGRMDDIQNQMAMRAAGEVASLPIWVSATPRNTVAAIVAAVRQNGALRSEATRLVVVDYLGLLQTSRPAANENARITEISRALKTAALDLSVPFLVLAQLNRGVENDGGREPELRDLRDSGSVEQDADSVVFIHATQKERREAFAQKRPQRTSLIVAKQRDGSIGRMDGEFDYRMMRLEQSRTPELTDN